MKLSSRYALMVDAENCRIGSFEPLFNDIRRAYNITVFRVYGNWCQNRYLGGWLRFLRNRSILPVQKFSPNSRKNICDMILTTEAVALLFTRPLDGLILAASDVDYTPLITLYKESGKDVIGIGRKDTPECLKRLYNKFYILESKKNSSVGNGDV